MRETITYVTQSKYFSPSFNAAIFDGPIRIYFAQYQEAQALKLYHNLQERFSDVRKHARGIFKERGQNIFVMLYPTPELFESSFGEMEDAFEASELDATPAIRKLGMGAGAESGSAGAQNRPLIVLNRLGSDYVLGVNGPMEDETFETLCTQMERIVKSPENERALQS